MRQGGSALPTCISALLLDLLRFNVQPRSHRPAKTFFAHIIGPLFGRPHVRPANDWHGRCHDGPPCSSAIMLCLNRSSAPLLSLSPFERWARVRLNGQAGATALRTHTMLEWYQRPGVIVCGDRHLHCPQLSLLHLLFALLSHAFPFRFVVEPGASQNAGTLQTPLFCWAQQGQDGR